MSVEATKTARRYGLRVSTGAIEDVLYPAGSFGVIFSHFTIEHIPNPHSFVAAVRRVLKPGGIFVCGTDDFGCLDARLINALSYFGHGVFSEIKPPEHVIMYSKRTLGVLLERQGFEVLAVRDPNGRRLSEIQINHPVARTAQWLLTPLLRRLPGDNEFVAVARSAAKEVTCIDCGQDGKK